MSRTLLVILTFAWLSCASQNRDSLRAAELRTNGIIQSGCGAYMHCISVVFLTKGMNNPDAKMPFAFLNVIALQLDIIGVTNIVRAKRLKNRIKTK